MADKPAQDYQHLNDKNLCLSLLGLVHKSGNSIYWFSALKKCIHTYPVLWMGAKLQFSTRETGQRGVAIYGNAINHHSIFPISSPFIRDSLKKRKNINLKKNFSEK